MYTRRMSTDGRMYTHGVARRWHYKAFGSATDPIHKSQLNAIAGDYGCPTRFRFERDELAERAAAAATDLDLERPVSGYAAAGTAAHETIARALNNPSSRARLLAGGAWSQADVRKVFDLEYEREVGGRAVTWRHDEQPLDLLTERVIMVTTLLTELHKYVADDGVILVEPAFIVRRGSYWLSGHIDLVYRPRADPSAIAIADWKTGATRPDEIELAHGWEAGIYSAAVHDGYFLSRSALDVTVADGIWTAHAVGAPAHCTGVHASRYIAERIALESALVEVARAIDAKAIDGLDPRLAGAIESFGLFPWEVYHVQLHDYVPYERAGKKRVSRPDDLRFYKCGKDATVRFQRGDRRGPAWLRVQLAAYDLPRLDHRLRQIVGTIRMGRFADRVCEQCKRCPFADQCLTTGYAETGDERRELESTLRALGADAHDGLGDDGVDD